MSEKEVIEAAKEAVKKYDVDAAKAVAAQAIAEHLDLSKVIQDGFSAGMTEVGDLFGQKKLFLPHVMAAAQTMTAAIDVLTPELKKQGGKQKTLGTVVICTVEGDIHSIGKDIVAVMLGIGGFTVVNLGKDVPAAAIIDACRKDQAFAVATSALMTSTMVNQKALEEALRADGIRDSLITNVGGAPVSQEWADTIGADLYSENATDAVAKFRGVAVKD